MSDVFLKILGMSAAGGVTVLAVLLLRLALKKAPKLFSYILWAAVFFRLLCPFTAELPVGIPAVELETKDVYEYVAQSPVTAKEWLDSPDEAVPLIKKENGRITFVTSEKGVRPAYSRSRNIIETASFVWAAGAAAMLVYGLISFIRLKARLRGAVYVNGVYISENITNSFVIGVFRPRIYLPDGLSDERREYVLLHEKTHIKRLDHILKILMFAALCLHWFNPLAWLAFRLCEQDMEMSCDERVTSGMPPAKRAEYSQTLLDITAMSPAAFTACFSDRSVKSRVSGVLNYKKPALRVIIICVLTAGAALVMLSFNKNVSGAGKHTMEEIRAEAEKISEIDEKLENLDLSKAVVYLPSADEIENFSLSPKTLSADEREALLLEAAEKFTGKTADKSALVYYDSKMNASSYEELKDDPERGNKNYFLKYQTDEYDLGINIGGNYIYARPLEFAGIAGKENGNYWIEEGTRLAKYDLRQEIPDEDIELLNGRQKLSEIVNELLPKLQNEFPYYRSDTLVYKPINAEVHKLGDRSAVTFQFYYEYAGVPLDYCGTSDYMNVNADGRCLQTGFSPEASVAYVNGADELYGSYDLDIVPSNEKNSRFTGLSEALSTASEKLTGASVFRVESVELCYGLKRILPSKFYDNADAKSYEYDTLRIDASPVWVVTVPATGIAATPSMKIVVDALTGEAEVFAYDRR